MARQSRIAFCLLPLAFCLLPVRLELLGILQVRFFQRWIAAQESMLRHIRGVAAGRWCAAKRLGHTANMVRAGPAADTQVIDAHVKGFPREIGYLVASAGERVQGSGEWQSVLIRWALGIAK